MLTVPEAARRLSCSPETVRRWIRSGRLRSKKIGTQHLIEEKDIDGFRGDEILPIPRMWSQTATGEPMPDVIGSLRRSRIAH